MRPLLTLLALSLCIGCASRPPPPPPKDVSPGEAAATMGLFLMMLGAQEKNSTSAKFLQVKIPPAALDVIVSLQAQRKTLGRWPKPEEVKPPEGISEFALLEGPTDLDVALKTSATTAFRCTLAPDGTLIVMPPLEEFVAALNGSFRP